MAIAVEGEVTESLELVTQLRLRVFQARFALGVDDFETVRIQMLLEVTGGVGFRYGEEPVVQAHLCVNGMGRADPVNRAFDFAPRVRTPALAVEIGGAP